MTDDDKMEILLILNTSVRNFIGTLNKLLNQPEPDTPEEFSNALENLMKARQTVNNRDVGIGFQFRNPNIIIFELTGDIIKDIGQVNLNENPKKTLD